MVYVFKTTVLNNKAELKLKSHLNKLISDSKWNFDLEDCDNILRVESTILKAEQIINLLQSRNFDCIELE